MLPCMHRPLTIFLYSFLCNKVKPNALTVRYIVLNFKSVRKYFIFLNVKYIFMKKNVYTYHMKTLG